jgi:hypothetical protein
MGYNLIFLSLAAICNAIMDTLQFHFETSVFSKLNKNYWNPNISWRNKYINGDIKLGRIKILWIFDKPVMLTDAWHLFKSLMITFLFLSIFTFNIKLNYWYTILILFAVYKVIWGIYFEAFYKFILRR